MASLAGKADPTLVKMAYAASVAGAPGDYSQQYKDVADIHKGFLTDIETEAASYKINKELDLAALNTAMAVFDDPLSVQIIDSDYTSLQEEVAAQRESYPGTDDPKALQDWNRKNQQIIGRYKQAQNDLSNILESWKGDLYDKGNMKPDDINFMTYLADYNANVDSKSGKFNAQATSYMQSNPKATMVELWGSLSEVQTGDVVKYKDPETGEYIYVSKVGENVMAKKSSELKEAFKLKATSAETGLQERLNKVQKYAETTTKNWSEFSTENKNWLGNFIDDELEVNSHALRYLMSKKMGMQDLSFEEALRSGKDGIGMSASIIKSLKTLGWTDENKNNKLDRDDFASGKEGTDNYNTVVESILNGTDKDLSKNLYLEYTDETVFKPAHNRSKKIETVDKKDKGDIYGKPFYSHAEVKDIGIDSETSGNFIQLDPNTREAVYRSVVDRSKTFKGTMGYYALVTGKGKDGVVRNGYVRYKSRAEYLEDLKDKTLDASSTPYADRFVTFDRLLEIEGASKGGSVSKVKSRI